NAIFPKSAESSRRLPDYLLLPTPVAWSLYRKIDRLGAVLNYSQGNSALLMCGVLRLGRLELDFDGLLFFVDIELLPESLVVLGDYLNQNLALGDRRNACDAVLVGLQLPTGADFLAELHHRAAFDESHQNAGPVDWIVGQVFDFDAQFSCLRASGPGESARQQHGPEQKRVSHNPIIVGWHDILHGSIRNSILSRDSYGAVR